MEYEADVWKYAGAVATTAAAALILKRRKALAIAAALGLMVSNPGSMKKCAQEWRESGTEVNLVSLRDEITRLKNQVKADKHWEGEAYEAFSAAADAFTAALDENQKCRKGAADTLDQTAFAYHAGADFAVVVAAAMSAMAMAFIVSYPFPPYRTAVNLMINPVLDRIDTVVKAVVKRKMTLVGGAGAILAVVNGFQYNQKHLFMGMRVLPEKKPDFTQAGLQYNNATGLTKKTSG
ncbi:hypothetical protein [Streptosporangium sp. NPDC087985]|uniref:hypothetical protein n=1 Tax=Streptosporangium sp. NPDC087985 TaxID=3366196 RepID=UPI00382AFD3F